MSEVFFGEEDFGLIYMPGDIQIWVLDRNATVSLRMVVVVAFILEDGYIAEDSEAVGETSWNEELTMIVFGQFYCYMLAIGR